MCGKDIHRDDRDDKGPVKPSAGKLTQKENARKLRESLAKGTA